MRCNAFSVLGYLIVVFVSIFHPKIDKVLYF
jgi:hypothetical protein